MAIPGFDGTGIYTRHYSWRADETNSIGIVSDRHDAEDDEFAKGMNLAFCRDGQATATGNFKMGNYKITGLGAATADNDAVPLSMLTGSSPSGVPNIQKALNLTGIDAAGRLNFLGLTGIQGIAWAGADFSWVAKIGVASQYTHRLALNNAFNALGTDVAWFEDNGNLRVPSLIQNLAIDPAGQLRVISAGYGAQLRMDTTGVVIAGIDTATVGGSYLLPAVGLQDRVELQANGGSATINLRKKSGTFVNAIRAYTGPASTGLRWQMYLGNGTAESAGAGSDFVLTPFNDSGVSVGNAIVVYRKTGLVNFAQGLTGLVPVDNAIDRADAGMIIGGKGTVTLRPNNYNSTSGQVVVDVDSGSGVPKTTFSGYIYAWGMQERAGTPSAPAGGLDYINIDWVSAGNTRVWDNQSVVGVVPPPCDYRLKDEVKPLAGMWNAIKQLRPITFKYRADAFRKGVDDKRRFAGFLAHELQDALGETAATGKKDGDDTQNPNIMGVVAALTAALQEAMLRIEALEAKLA
jgi:Chaperone of endosialidase